MDQEVMSTPKYVGYRAAKEAIASRTAEAFALWVLLSDESQRDGYALRPMPWEGSGEYQHVRYADGRNGFVRIPIGEGLPTRAAIAKAEGR
ncbi:MAG TPA: hypothetical protein VFT69_16955 [Pseudolabrys sp.]|nr:hypothetical protein [Pseudolabrys sp.]